MTNWNSIFLVSVLILSSFRCGIKWTHTSTESKCDWLSFWGRNFLLANKWIIDFAAAFKLYVSAQLLIFNYGLPFHFAMACRFWSFAWNSIDCQKCINQLISAFGFSVVNYSSDGRCWTNDTNESSGPENDFFFLLSHFLRWIFFSYFDEISHYHSYAYGIDRPLICRGVTQSFPF